MDFFKNEIDKLTEAASIEDRYKLSSILSELAGEGSRFGKLKSMNIFNSVTDVDEEFVYNDIEFVRLYSELKELFLKYGFNNMYTNVAETSEKRDVIMQMQREIFDARKL